MGKKKGQAASLVGREPQFGDANSKSTLLQSVMWG